MDIDEITTFVAIAELGGFTRAAQRLHRTQPAISRRLNLLEQELGTPVFERIRGNARLTEAGRAFLPYAEAALAALRDGQAAFRLRLSERSPTRTSCMRCAGFNDAPRTCGSSCALRRAAK